MKIRNICLGIVMLSIMMFSCHCLDNKSKSVILPNGEQIQVDNFNHDLEIDQVMIGLTDVDKQIREVIPPTIEIKLINQGKYDVEFPEDYNARLFLYSEIEGRWDEINLNFDNPYHQTYILHPGGMMGSIDFIRLHPDLEISGGKNQTYRVHIFVFGNTATMPDREEEILVGAGLEMKWTP